MPSFVIFTSLLTVALAGALPRQQLDATGVTRTGAITYYNTGGGSGACGTTLSDNGATCAVSTTLYDACNVPVPIDHLAMVAYGPCLPYVPIIPLHCFERSFDTKLTCWIKDTQGGNPNDNSLCGKKIKVTVNGQSTTVIVADRCAGCAEMGLGFDANHIQYYRLWWRSGG